MAKPTVDTIEFRLLTSLVSERNFTDFNSAYTLYEAAFPEESERELRNEWLERLTSDDKPRKFELFVASNGQSVIGGVAYLFYPLSNSGLLAFIFVDPRAQGQGVGRQLVQLCLFRLFNFWQVRRVFAEAEDPALVVQMKVKSSIDPTNRIKILSSLGGKLIDFAYIQPALGKGRPPASHLKMIEFSEAEYTNRQDVWDFLHEYYTALGLELHEIVAILDSSLSEYKNENIPLKPLTDLISKEI